MVYVCCDEGRRIAVQASELNGIDFLEVLDRDAPPPPKHRPPFENRQRFLLVHFLKSQGLDALTVDHFRIEGGERITDIDVIAVTPSDEQDTVLQLEVNQPGDFSTYRLRLGRDSVDGLPLAGFDPILSILEFSFKVECPSDFDCKPTRVCPPDVPDQTVIDYLAKDYASFRRLMLDRLATLLPDWKDRNAADLGMVLVELLAYVADRLSYEQDAIATEAYLGTARKRISVRRHARLVDYFMHDGSNARTWVQIRVDADIPPADDLPALAAGTPLCTPLPDQQVVIAPDNRTPQLLAKADAVFETMHPLRGLFADHIDIPFYTWSAERCCLTIGATRATLARHLPELRVGDVLVFEEVKGPKTGVRADAVPTHRHPVRLTHVQAFTPSENDEPSTEPLADPVTGTKITEIRWHSEDALPFPLCLSSRTDAGHGEAFVGDVSLAQGNIVLADHGRTVADEDLGEVPSRRLSYAAPPSQERCHPKDPKAIHPRFTPRLKERPLTQAAPFAETGSARSASRWERRTVTPQLTLSHTGSSDVTWEAKRDLLNSDKTDLHVVVEIESDGTAMLRFGDDDRGKRPDAGTQFTATYRVGNGLAGNIAVDSLHHIVTEVASIRGVRNLTPGIGGTEPESLEDVRQRAPYAFRTQERAVTPKDYEEVTGRHPDVQRAAATFRWTGSWYTVFLTVDRKGGLPVDGDFETEIRSFVERYRMAGYDLEVEAPHFVPLEIEMSICVKPDYFRSEVKKALLTIFSNQRLPHGGVGLFHPDNFTFGQTVYLSPLIAAAQAVPGVASVAMKKFQRQRYPDLTPLEDGKLEMGRLEIAQLDNDRNFPERGVFTLTLGGGK